MAIVISSHHLLCILKGLVFISALLFLQYLGFIGDKPIGIALEQVGLNVVCILHEKVG